MNPLLPIIKSQLEERSPIQALFLVQGEWIPLRHPRINPESTMVTGLHTSFGETCWIDISHIVAFRFSGEV